MGETCSTCGERNDVYGVLVGKREGKNPLGRTKRRWNDIKMNFQLLEIWGMDCKRWQALVEGIMNLGVE
jgi:hypothetical protein